MKFNLLPWSDPVYPVYPLFFCSLVIFCCLPTMSALGTIEGEVVDNIGDTSKGYWRGIPFQEGTCPIMGEPDEPFDAIVSSRTTTQGRNRLLSWVLGPGETTYDNCEETGATGYASCINGFQATSAQLSMAHYIEAFADNERFVGCKMTAESSFTCKFRHVPPREGFYERKTLLCERPYRYYEWRFYDNQLNDPEFKVNLGPACTPME